MWASAAETWSAFLPRSRPGMGKHFKHGREYSTLPKIATSNQALGLTLIAGVE